ncbi:MULTISPECIES: helix-turn-helix transcriptional regulator [unclassified Kitasatospora]|uniref:helix-turn-helix domain-containing protein n=1 Tax=unclassified Kitasatospora TaxID=2633591 RepID=UPI0033E63409
MADQEAQSGGTAQPRCEEDFAAELRTLRLDAGQPSFRTMARAVGCISHTTLFEAVTGSRLPSWPTTRAFVRACGGDEEEWHHRWRTAADGGKPPATPAPSPPPTPSAPAPPALALPAPAGPVPLPRPATFPAAPRRGLPRLWTHAFSLLLGLVLGVSGTLGLVATRAPDASLDADNCPSAHGDSPSPEPQPEARGSSADLSALSWVAHTAVEQQDIPSTELALPVRAAAAPGDALVVSMMLTTTCPGPVTVTDGHDDRFQLVGDVTDALRRRVLVLAAFAASALTTADSIRATYPRASTSHVSVDEFRGATTVSTTARSLATATATATATAFDHCNAAGGAVSPWGAASAVLRRDGLGRRPGRLRSTVPAAPVTR